MKLQPKSERFVLTAALISTQRDQKLSTGAVSGDVVHRWRSSARGQGVDPTTLLDMIHPILQVTDPWGVVLRREAIARGCNDNVLHRLVRDGTLIRLRQGVYALRAVYLAADNKTRHLMLCRGVMRLYAGHIALSHGSAALAQGGPDYGIDLVNAHVTHLEGGGRNVARVVHHNGACRVGDLRRQDGHWITAPPRTILDVACVSGAEAGLVQANHFLHLELTSLDELRTVAKVEELWPHSLAHHLVLHLADPRVESVGETRSSFLFFGQGLPAPVPQFEIPLSNGELARVDFAWPDLRVIVEFDGVEKYHRFRKPGETIEQMVMREKRREDLIREATGWTVIRLTWRDLDQPVATGLRIRRAMAPFAA